MPKDSKKKLPKENYFAVRLDAESAQRVVTLSYQTRWSHQNILLLAVQKGLDAAQNGAHECFPGVVPPAPTPEPDFEIARPEVVKGPALANRGGSK